MPLDVLGRGGHKLGIRHVRHPSSDGGVSAAGPDIFEKFIVVGSFTFAGVWVIGIVQDRVMKVLTRFRHC